MLQKSYNYYKKNVNQQKKLPLVIVSRDNVLVEIIKNKRLIMDLNGKRILITGASSGLGRELAYQFSRKGNVDLILVARRKEALDKVAKKCESLGKVTTETYSVDMSSQEEVEGLLQNVSEIDILINAAGYGLMKDYNEFSDYEVVKMFDTNVIGTIQLTSEIAKEMQERKAGSIVTIASLAGKIATPKTSVYSATKFALIGYFNALRLELKKDNVHVMTVNPGPVATNFFNIADKDKTYIKALGNKSLTPKLVASKIIRGIEREKREVNLPFIYTLGVKISQLFPRLSDRILMNMFK